MSTTSRRISISPKKDFLERLSSTSPISALAEVIWNGLDSASDEVRVEFTRNKLDGIEEIRVIDSGTGIPPDAVETLFGNLGDSWKKTKGRHKGRALHGKNGQGRLKAFALGNRVSWQTTFATDGGSQSYTISGSATALDSFSYTAPTPANGKAKGTTVIISGIDKSHGELLADNAREELAKLFAAYLSQYPDVRILFDGTPIDPTILQEHKREVIIDAIDLGDGRTVDASVSIIEWRMQTKRAIHLCDANSISLHEIEPGIQAAGFNFTAYIKCDHFRELDKSNLLIVGDLHPDVKAILTKGKGAIRNHFRKRAAERQRQIVEIAPCSFEQAGIFQAARRLGFPKMAHYMSLRISKDATVANRASPCNLSRCTRSCRQAKKQQVLDQALFLPFSSAVSMPSIRADAWFVRAAPKSATAR
jgi:hypothetical protein